MGVREEGEASLVGALLHDLEWDWGIEFGGESEGHLPASLASVNCRSPGRPATPVYVTRRVKVNIVQWYLPAHTFIGTLSVHIIKL